MWKKILKTAIQTPSPHNVQPWRVKIIDDFHAELLIDSSRTLPKEDLTGSFIILTMGMFLESLANICKNESYKLSFEIIPKLEQAAEWTITNKTPSLFLFARMELIPANNQIKHYPNELYFKRRTSRISLLPLTVPENALQNLNQIAEEYQQIFAYTTDKTKIEQIIQRNIKALFEDLNAPDYHDEIVEWFRFSEKESSEKLDGLDYHCMNTPRLTFWISARFPWLMQIPVMSGILAKIYRKQLGIIPTIGFISGGFWQPDDALEAGRFLMRFWLETAHQNLYILPFGNLVTNRPAAKDIEQLAGIENIWLVFKIGYSPEPPKSFRLPVEKILVP